MNELCVIGTGTAFPALMLVASEITRRYTISDRQRWYRGLSIGCLSGAHIRWNLDRSSDGSSDGHGDGILL